MSGRTRIASRATAWPPAGSEHGQDPSGRSADGALVAASPFDTVRAELDELEAILRDDEGIEIEIVGELLRSIFRSGGKRIRPALVFVAAGLGPSDRRAVLDLAAAIETLHTATLVHDDLVDGSLIRRGAPTLNVRWSAGATVLTGDWLFARSARFATRTGDIRLMQVFARTLSTLTEGELRQLAGRSGIPTYEEYDLRIYAKTASLFEAATECAGILLDLPAAGIEALAAYGRGVGKAFQVIDDLLDFTGDPDRIGKPVGGDLRSGQVTLPLMLHLERHPSAAPWLRGTDADRGGAAGQGKGEGRGEGEGEGEAGPAKAGTEAEAVDELIEAVRADEIAIRDTRAVARDHAARAIAALGALPASEARDRLAAVAELAVARDA